MILIAFCLAVVLVSHRLVGFIPWLLIACVVALAVFASPLFLVVAAIAAGAALLFLNT